MGRPPNWVRVTMHRETERWVEELNPEKLDVFEISGHKWSGFPFKSYSNGMFPGLDICEQSPHGEYNLIIAEQVWAHLKYPYRSAGNVLNALRPGATLLITVPVLLRIHPIPLDCSRWTAEGLRYFCKNAVLIQPHSEPTSGEIATV